ncbi:vWA domain-containing protein [Arthrobacter sp. EPSL27]|uniref:vWA domain-containing protein n=1 Tax=Arthrobacter sp. EPSL27 TaxID=1745378 RepID=UPI0007480300|nr:vWA domain-containing protein [Arthrobacter sp. EPSL27]KUM32873.1 hypothetical protein AR539_12750 [Arthrobacter sp. EPSL27]
MTFNPVLSWWLLGPLAAAAVLGLCWILFRTRAQPEAAQPEENRAWLFRAALVLLLLLAASRPGLPGGAVQAAATNLNVFFVVDTSSSIAAEDHVSADGGGPRAPRLDGVRADILAVARELGGARYSLITFDSGAAVRMPLTADTSALETAVAVLTPQVTSYSQGSGVTAARTVLAERLAAARDTQPERPRLVFYFGDGEQTSAAAPRDMRLDGSLVSGGAVLGYGTRDGGRMRENSGDVTRPAQTYIQDPATGTDALSRLDEDRLRGIAQQLAVPYVHRLAGDGPAPMLRNAAPGTLERTGESLNGRTELYWLPAFAAFLLALRETLLVSRELRDLKPARQQATAGRGPRT